MTDRPKYVYEDRDRHGTTRIYFWRGKGHPKIRLKGDQGSPEWWEAYGAALRGEHGVPLRPAAEGTFRWLCQRYMASGEFMRLGPRTRRVRRSILEGCLAEPIAPEATETFAGFPLGKLSAKAIGVLRDRKAGLPEAANGRLKAIRQVFAWAIQPEVGLVDRNPARDVKYITSTGDGFHTWTVEEVRKFEEKYPIGTRERLALALMAFTGVRRSDLVQLGRQMVRDGWLYFRETKGQARKVKDRAVPILPELQRVIDGSPVGNMTFVVTEFGAPFSAAGFGNWFGDRCRAAGVPGRAHGLRKAGATIAAENGATEHQLMAIFGWETTKQAAVYTKKASRKRLAGDAMHLLVPAETGTNLSHQKAGDFPTEGQEADKIRK